MNNNQNPVVLTNIVITETLGYTHPEGVRTVQLGFTPINGTYFRVEYPGLPHATGFVAWEHGCDIASVLAATNLVRVGKTTWCQWEIGEEPMRIGVRLSLHDNEEPPSDEVRWRTCMVAYKHTARAKLLDTSSVLHVDVVTPQGETRTLIGGSDALIKHLFDAGEEYALLREFNARHPDRRRVAVVAAGPGAVLLVTERSPLWKGYC